MLGGRGFIWVHRLGIGSGAHILFGRTMLGSWPSFALLGLLFLYLEGESCWLLDDDVLVQSFLLHDILSQTNCERTSSCKLSYTFLLKTHDRERVGSVQHIAKS